MSSGVATLFGEEFFCTQLSDRARIGKAEAIPAIPAGAVRQLAGLRFIRFRQTDPRISSGEMLGQMFAVGGRDCL